MMHVFPSSQCHLHNCHQNMSKAPWKPLVSSCPPVSAVELLAFSTSEKLIYSSEKSGTCLTSSRRALIGKAVKAAQSHDLDDSLGEFTIASSSNGDMAGKASKGSGTTARGRRLLKIREEKRKREYDRLHNYPTWAKVLEDACKNDEELRAVLGDSVGNPELMRKRVEERVRKRGRDFNKSKAGSVLAFKVSFRDVCMATGKAVSENKSILYNLVNTVIYSLEECFNPIDSYIWFELYGSPSDRDVDLLGSVIQSWYVMGRLGAYNSSNLQLAGSSVEDNPLYDDEKGSTVMPSSFHDISNVEFQDNWGRVWVDLGTSDFFAIDVLLNCLTGLSSEYMGIQQVVFGGRTMGDWEEGMTSTDDGYKYFKI